MARKIYLYTTEEVKNLSPKIKFAVNDKVKKSKPDSSAVIDKGQSSAAGPAGSSC